ncbi:MAG: Coenzyme F420 hydrogenase/dehydrogenase, beta subunit C-terminal domain [Chitinispirillaceae bacterium]|nr:Coenzyme F420 hydrogenase/dehydrogenase, beta subunit C-terminal domain [Chitinispirillaceae bacterium]
MNKKQFSDIPSAYLCRVKSSDILNTSTSGGAFTPIAQYVINKGGVVFGASFDENWKVRHTSATTIEEVSKFRGSKYVQSDLGKSFSEVKSYLKEGKWVCFSGTPCQASGLVHFLNRKYEKLIIVDFVCHGTPSPLFWKKYIKYHEYRNKSKVRSVAFRNKTYGYHSSTMRVQFENGKVYSGSNRVDLFMKSFFQDVCSRPSCYQCNFKSIQHDSDFTIFDAWHASKLVEDLNDDDKGYTNVLLQSKIGLKIFEEIKPQLHYYPTDIQKAIEIDGVMVYNSVPKSTNRDTFLSAVLNTSVGNFEQEVLKFIRITTFDKLCERVKPLLFTFGILSALKRIKYFVKKIMSSRL